MTKNLSISDHIACSGCHIMDCTLRDGSYINHFQFTHHDTKTIVQALESLGVSLIEVGHGIGMGASRHFPHLAAVEADETYMRAAAEAVKNSYWGMFAIPGIATLEDIASAADHGMNFIRIGVNMDQVSQIYSFAEAARDKGLYVCANIMKSYAAAPAEFASIAAEIAQSGLVDLLYIVDSSGGMLPEELSEYIEAVQATCPELALGFHGHHNLGMGVANSRMAIQKGVRIVDTSLQGLGRGGGNTPTEQMVAALLRSGIDLGIDPVAACEVGESLIQPIVEQRGLSSVDVISGLALFHSSYMPVIKKYASEYGIDPRRLILAVCEHNIAEAPEPLVAEQAQKLASHGESGQWKPRYKQYIGEEQSAA